MCPPSPIQEAGAPWWCLLLDPPSVVVRWGAAADKPQAPDEESSLSLPSLMKSRLGGQCRLRSSSSSALLSCLSPTCGKPSPTGAGLGLVCGLTLAFTLCQCFGSGRHLQSSPGYCQPLCMVKRLHYFVATVAFLFVALLILHIEMLSQVSKQCW